MCLYKEVDKKYTGCNLKATELLDRALIGVCVVIRLNTVFFFQSMGRVQHNENVQQQYGGGQQFSVFDGLNQRLIDYGVPRFNIGQHTVEPIVLVGFILAGLLLGLPGLLLGALLFFVSKMSTGGGLNSFFGGGGQGQGQGPSAPRSSQGGGYRLGNS